MKLSQRIVALHEGPNRLALPFHGNGPFTLLWADEQDFGAFPELDDVEDQLAAYLLLATAERSDELRAILVSKAEPHAVVVFFEGFHGIADDLDDLGQKLFMFGQPSPAELLRAALGEASRFIEAGQFTSAIDVLERSLAGYTAPSPDASQPLSTLLSQGFTDLGFAWHRAGDAAKAARAYEVGAAHGSVPAGINLLTMHRDARDWASAKLGAEALLSGWKNPDDLTSIRASYALALAALGDAHAIEKLTAEHISYLKWLASDELEQATSLRDQLVTALKDADIGAGARDLLEPMWTALAQVSLFGKSKVPNEREISKALEFIAKKQELKLTNLVGFKGAIAKDPRVVEAVAKLGEPATSVFRSILDRARS